MSFDPQYGAAGSQAATPKYLWWTLWYGVPNIHLCDIGQFKQIEGTNRDWTAGGGISSCSSSYQTTVRAFSLIAVISMYIAATMMFPWFKRFQEEGHRKLTTFVFSFLAAVSAAIVIGVYFNQIDPTTYRNIRINDDKSSKTFLDSLPKTAVPTGACSLVQFTDSTGTAPSASCEENAALYGVWFEGATLILAAIICIMMIFDHLKSERAEPVENSKRMTLAAKFKGFWVVMTVFTSFFPYVRLNINPNHPKITPNALQISENYDYGLWNSGPMCRESVPTFLYTGAQPVGRLPVFGDCTLQSLTLLRVLSVVAMVTSLVSYICILPRPKERAIASRRASFVFTFVGTMSLVAIAAVWTTTVDPGRYNVDTCTDVLGTLTGVLGKLDFSQCKFSWRQGAVFSYIALGFGALSFLLDVRLLLEDGNKFCSCSEPEVEPTNVNNTKDYNDLEDGYIRTRTSEKFIAEEVEAEEPAAAVVEEAKSGDDEDVSDLEIEIEKVQAANDDNDDGEPKSPYRAPGTPLGAISNWFKNSPKSSPNAAGAADNANPMT